MNQVSQEPILKTRGLSKHFGGAQVINQVDLQIRRGEVRCVIGPNGAGKSTFFKL
ncbi:TPA: ATP-binding cassette domain-containing protein, partial [Klebsiella variicola]